MHTIEDALVRLSYPQPVECGPSGVSESSQQVLIEELPPVFILHLKRFLYDVDSVKIKKPVQFTPALKIQPGTIFSLLSSRSSRG